MLPDDQAILKELSQRAPRNEVARFILKDLDTAISRLKDQGFQNNQRINKQTAQLLKSRVALFEATFENITKAPDVFRAMIHGREKTWNTIREKHSTLQEK